MKHGTESGGVSALASMGGCKVRSWYRHDIGFPGVVIAKQWGNTGLGCVGWQSDRPKIDINGVGRVWGR